VGGYGGTKTDLYGEKKSVQKKVILAIENLSAHRADEGTKQQRECHRGRERPELPKGGRPADRSRYVSSLSIERDVVFANACTRNFNSWDPTGPID